LPMNLLLLLKAFVYFIIFCISPLLSHKTKRNKPTHTLLILCFCVCNGKNGCVLVEDWFFLLLFCCYDMKFELGLVVVFVLRKCMGTFHLVFCYCNVKLSNFFLFF
jgi:hypothetical protein